MQKLMHNISIILPTLRTFLDFYADFGIGIPPHYIANVNVLLCQPPHLHYNAVGINVHHAEFYKNSHTAACNWS